MISIKWTTRPAQLVARGEEVSEIKWRDTGSVQALANEQIEFGENKCVTNDQTPTTSRTRSGRAKSVEPVTACGMQNASSAMKKTKKSDWPDSSRITVLVAGNPKRRTAAQRFALYRNGMTVAEYKAAVGEKQAVLDLRWDVKMQFIKIELSL